MEIVKSDLVQATAGREKGKLFFVVGEEGEYLFLADGRGRRLDAPKRKKRKHVRFIASDDSRAAAKLRSGEKVTNSELRRAIASYGGAGIRDQEG